MLPTFVIGLREGLEAALIVGIVAAFLRQRGRIDLLRWAFVGVGAAAALCLAIGIALDIVSNDLPQRQQEGLETVIGAVAVTMVTYMVVWMRRHARTLRAQLEGAADHALAAGSGFALVLMAFLAVLREGLETVVFLLAAFNQAGSGALAPLGAVLGIVLAIVLGWGIYRGGVRLNLTKFFRITGIVLAFVAAGLVVSALHTAHEAGWLNIGQQSTVDLSAFVAPGSVQAALLTGMLGVQPRPVLIEVVGWLVYLVPVVLYVAIPPSATRRLSLSSTAVRLGLAATAAVAVVAAVVLAIALPGRPGHFPVTQAGGARAQVTSVNAGAAAITATVVHPASAAGSAGSPGTAGRPLTALRIGTQTSDGVGAIVYRVTLSAAVPGASTTMTLSEVAERNGGRLPLGVRAGDGTATVPVQTGSVDVGTFVAQASTGRVLDFQWRETTTLTAQLSIGATVLGSPATATWQLPEAAAAAAARAARADQQTLDHRSLIGALAVVAWLIAGIAAVLIAGLALNSRRRGPSADLSADASADPSADPLPGAVRSATSRSALVKS